MLDEEKNKKNVHTPTLDNVVESSPVESEEHELTENELAPKQSVSSLAYL